MDDEQLFQQFAKVHWMLNRYHMKNQLEFGPMGDPHRGQGRVLSLLKMQPEITQKDLSYILGITPQSLGELLTKLEKNGYITRESSESDRRAMIIKLTKEGRKAAERMTDTELFSCLDDDEKDTLSEYLQRISDSLGKEIGVDDSPFGLGLNEDEIRKIMQEGLKRLKDGFRGLEDFGKQFETSDKE